MSHTIIDNILKEDGSNLLQEDGVSLYVIEGAVAEAVEHASTGGGWAALSFYDRYSQKKQKRQKKHKQDIEEIKQLPETDKEIAKLLHKQLEREDRNKEIAELDLLIQSSFSKRQARKAKAYNDRVGKAYLKAHQEGTFSAIEKFERELDRVIEEDEFLVLAMAVLG